MVQTAEQIIPAIIAVNVRLFTDDPSQPVFRLDCAEYQNSRYDSLYSEHPVFSDCAERWNSGHDSRISDQRRLEASGN